MGQRLHTMVFDPAPTRSSSFTTYCNGYIWMFTAGTSHGHVGDRARRDQDRYQGRHLAAGYYNPGGRLRLRTQMVVVFGGQGSGARCGS